MVAAVRTGRTTVESDDLFSLSGAPIAFAGGPRVTNNATWAKNRYEATRALLLADAWPVVAQRAQIRGDAELEARIVRLSVTVWALESGWGRYEFNWNAAGIGCQGTARCIEGVSDDGAPLEAFVSFVGFVRRFWAVITQTRYASALELLFDDREPSAEFYRRLYAAGYGSDRAARELPDVEILLARYLGVSIPAPRGAPAGAGAGGGRSLWKLGALALLAYRLGR